MALILEGGAVFLHIPKTGGTWVTEVLKECGLVNGGLSHMHVNMERLMVPFKTRNGKMVGPLGLWRIARTLKPKPFIFCFVRHPLKWYESWFKYMSQPSRNWCAWGDEKDLFRWHPNAVLNGCGAPEFNQFVRNVVAKRPGYVSELYASYAQPQVDFVGKQENLRADLVAVLKRLNEPPGGQCQPRGEPSGAMGAGAAGTRGVPRTSRVAALRLSTRNCRLIR